jgi:TrmH family RNA methyltransferase
VVEGVEKPGNLGAILRSADGAGLDAVVAADPRTDLYNPNAIRASLGTIFSLPLATASSAETLAWLRAHGIRTVVARVDATLLHTEADLRGPLAIVLGSEALGLTEAWSGPGVVAVRVPMLGVADSLNVAAAAAVLFYEARRQRGPR